MMDMGRGGHSKAVGRDEVTRPLNRLDK